MDKKCKYIQNYEEHKQGIWSVILVNVYVFVLFFFLQHDAPVKTIHWIKAPNYSCVMTGSWDKTLKVWFLPEQMGTCACNVYENIYMKWKYFIKHQYKKTD